jgi:hypothetical protein
LLKLSYLASRNAAVATDAFSILRAADDSARRRVVEAAVMTGERETLADAERFVGPRFWEYVDALEPETTGKNITTIVGRATRTTDKTAQAVIAAFAARPDVGSRCAVADGLRDGGYSAVEHLWRLVRDPSHEVVAAAAAALATPGVPGGPGVLVRRLNEIEAGGDAMEAARCVIAALGSCDDAEALTALRRLAQRSSVFRRANTAELRRLAAEALQSRMSGGTS